jgi:hypothetical protein
MIAYAAEAACGAWLGLIALTAVCTHPWRPRPAPASLALCQEPPALVSLLAGHLHRDGYPATLLDLAARGWFGMDEVEPGRVMCRLTAPLHDEGLTGYERRALAHLEFRAAELAAVPGNGLAPPAAACWPLAYPASATPRRQRLAARRRCCMWCHSVRSNSVPERAGAVYPRERGAGRRDMTLLASFLAICAAGGLARS